METGEAIGDGRAWGPATASPEQRRNTNVAGGATAPASCAGTLASPTAMQRPARPPPLFRSWVSCLAATARPASHTQGRAQDLGFGYSTFFKDEMFLTAAARCATLSPATQVA